jgi:hypothetical protein
MADCSNRAVERDPYSMPCGEEMMRVMFYEALQGMLVRAAKLQFSYRQPTDSVCDGSSPGGNARARKRMASALQSYNLGSRDHRTADHRDFGPCFLRYSGHRACHDLRRLCTTFGQSLVA